MVMEALPKSLTTSLPLPSICNPEGADSWVCEPERMRFALTTLFNVEAESYTLTALLDELARNMRSPPESINRAAMVRPVETFLAGATLPLTVEAVAKTRTC